MKFNPEYDRITCACSFATTAATACDDATTLKSTFRGLLHSIVVVPHSWSPLAAGASGMSGGLVDIIDDNGLTLLTTPETLTAATYVGSADIMLVGAHTIRYKPNTDNGDLRCVSGSDRTVADIVQPKVFLYVY
jgi:hypothetical protein